MGKSMGELRASIQGKKEPFGGAQNLDELLEHVASTILAPKKPKPSPWENIPQLSNEEVGGYLDLTPEEVERFKSMGHIFTTPTPEGGFRVNAPRDNPNLGSQFKGFTGGPIEAIMRQGESEGDSPEDYVQAEHPGGYGLESYPSRVAPPQGQLFDPDKVDLLEAHHQTPSQFAEDPRTWWHGRYTKSASISQEGEQSGEGFHAGTKQSAEERLAARYPSEIWPGYAAHLYPLRITGPIIGPHNIHMDQGYHAQLAEHNRAAGYLYENASEDAGSISVGAPHRQGWLSTHREMVQQAKAEGRYVHPLMEWAAEHHPEYADSPWEHPNITRNKEKYADYDMPAVSTEQGYQMGLFDKDEEAPEEMSTTHRFQTEGGHKVQATKMHQHPILGGQWAETRVMGNPDYHSWGHKMFGPYESSPLTKKPGP